MCICKPCISTKYPTCDIGINEGKNKHLIQKPSAMIGNQTIHQTTKILPIQTRHFKIAI